MKSKSMVLRPLTAVRPRLAIDRLEAAVLATMRRRAVRGPWTQNADRTPKRKER
jgi:hypothetical protein